MPLWGTSCLIWEIPVEMTSISRPIGGTGEGLQRSWRQAFLGGAGMNTWITPALCLTVLNLLPIWFVQFPPLQDYPYHLLRTHILSNYTNTFFRYDELYV